MFTEFCPEGRVHTFRSGRGERLGEDGLRNDAVPLEEIGDLKKKENILNEIRNQYLNRGPAQFCIIHHR